MKRNKLIIFLVFAGILLLTRSIAHRLIPFIEISGESPWGVVGPLAQMGINPITNYLRFGLFLLIPLILCVFFLFLLGDKIKLKVFLKEDFARKNSLIYSFCLMAILIVFSFGFSAMIWSPPLQYDAFHEGETLGPAALIRSGQTPYSEFVFCHGLFQDPYRSTFSFFLFGESISSSRFLESGLRIISLFLFAYLTYLLFNKSISTTVFSLLFLFSLNSSFLPNNILGFFDWNPISIMNVSRDALISLYLIISFLLKKQLKELNPSQISLFLLSLIPFLAIAYSVDRGFYLLTAHFFIVLPSIFFISHKKSIYRIGLISILGIGTGILVLFVALQYQFSAFFDYVFLTMPKYKEWLDGYLYKFNKFKYQNIALLFSLATILLSAFVYNVKKSNFKSLISSVWFELLFFAISIFLFRNALGRSDWSHVMYSTSFLLLFIIFMIDKIWFPTINHKIITLISLTIGLTFGVYTVSVGLKSGSFSRMFNLNQSDQEILPQHYFETKSFLIKNNVKDRDFYPLTSDATWFYVLGLRCPNRFPSMWFAAPNFYQWDVVNGLAKNKTTFILYNDLNNSGSFDGISNAERSPIIMNFIHENYAFDTVVSGNEIWRICKN